MTLFMFWCFDKGLNMLTRIRCTSLLLMLLFSSFLSAAEDRDAWVAQEIYAYNHPFKAQASGELATKMQKMAGSPFQFFRGTAHLFYRDMNRLPASIHTNGATRMVWLQGDMHLANLGAFRDAKGNTVFDTSDFDEGYWGEYVWDLRRMAVSILLAAKGNGISASDRQALVNDFVKAYLDQMADFKGNDDEQSWRLTAGNTSGVVKDTIQAAAAKSRADLLAKYTILSGSRRVFLRNAELVEPPVATVTAIRTAMTDYIASIAISKRYPASYYAVKDIRQKLGSGTGSLGRLRYYVLIEGPSSSTADDVILEMKQESASAVALAAPNRMPGWIYDNHEGQRVARTMKALLSNADVLAGYTRVAGVPYFLREKSPWQEDFDFTKLTSCSKFKDAVRYAGKVLAKNHALADKDYDATLIPYSQDKEITDIAPNTALRTEILGFALDYALQVEKDFNSFKRAYSSGAVLY